MSVQIRVELSRKIRQTIMGNDVEVRELRYKLSPKAFRLLYLWELHSAYELEKHESKDDLWFQKDRQYYNLNEFCTVGCPAYRVEGGPVQFASNGYFMIAAYQGNIHSVHISEIKHYEKVPRYATAGKLSNR